MYQLQPKLLLLVRNATLGRLFNTTKYGSITLEIKSDHHNIIAIIIPNIVPNKNPTTVSYTVTPTCINNWLSVKCKKVFNILLGWLIKKLSIIPFLARISHIPRNITNIKICVNIIINFLFCFSCIYFFLSFEIDLFLILLATPSIKY